MTNLDGDWTDDGNLEFEVTVSNQGESEDSGTLVVEAEVKGGSEYTERRDVTVAGGDSETYVIVFDVPPDEAESASGFDVRARIE